MRAYDLLGQGVMAETVLALATTVPSFCNDRISLEASRAKARAWSVTISVSSGNHRLPSQTSQHQNQ
jgi:hypothetical protein